MVWAGFSHSLTMPLTFFDENQNDESYMAMLRDKVLPFLRRKGVLRSTILVQDGARTHTSNRSLDFIKENFPAGFLSNRTDTPWPPNSPDLTPLDFWLWAYLKNMVYLPPRCQTIDELKEKIMKIYSSIPRSMFRHAIENVRNRAVLCIEQNGQHFENCD